MNTHPIVATAVAASLSLAVSATDIPKRKSGLWEIKTTSDAAGTGRPTSMQMCIDQATDDLLRGLGSTQDCSKNELKRNGDRIQTESVCKVMGTTTVSHGLFQGDFSAAYQGEVTTTYDPPMMGMKQGKTRIEAKWLSACKAGMTPGDMVLPDGRIINTNTFLQP